MVLRDRCACHPVYRQAHESPPYCTRLRPIPTCCQRRLFSPQDIHEARKSFLRKHLLPSNFDFIGYLQRCADNDLAKVLEVSIIEWAVFIIYIVLVGASEILVLQLLLPIIAFVCLGLAGIQIQHVLFMVAVLKDDRRETTDSNFWFGWPGNLLWLLRIAMSLFSISLAFTLFVVWKEGLPSCYFDELGMEWGWILYHSLWFVLGIAYVGYIKLPNYSLAVAMGSYYDHEALMDVISQRRRNRQARKEAEEIKRHNYGWLREAAAIEIQRKWREAHTRRLTADARSSEKPIAGGGDSGGAS